MTDHRPPVVYLTLQEGQRLKRAGTRREGAVALTGSSRARVVFDDGTDELVDREVDAEQWVLLNQVILDLSTWARLADVEAYAKERKIGKPDAIRRLVIMGLDAKER